MGTSRQSDSGIESFIARYLSDSSQRVSSRRGLFTWIGRNALRLSGLTLIPLLPIDRRSVALAQSTCSDWRLCGQCGNICAACCGGSGGGASCPSCLAKGQFGWTKCCYPDACSTPGTGTMYAYWDCCGSTSACHGTACTANCPQTAWCLDSSGASLGTYQCTIAIPGGSC